MSRCYGLLSNGNKKIGTDTLIFNMCSATECPSRKLGLCQLKNPNKCYALAAERRWPNVLDYRTRQQDEWEEGYYYYDYAIQHIKRKRPDIKYVRFNEAGDFKSQQDVQKLSGICRMNKDLTFYGYTARKDLSFAGLPDNLVVSGSGWRRRGMNKFQVVDTIDPKQPSCPSNCRNCSLCKVKTGSVIQTQLLKRKGRGT